MASAGGSRVMVTGAAGLLGRAVVAAGRAGGCTVTGLDRADLDICSRAALEAALARLEPDVIVNCAAYTNVDAAESHRAEAVRVNGVGPAVLAAAAAQRDVLLVHLSTDHVFDGNASQPYGVDDTPAPLSAYGMSKLCGEQAVQALAPRHYVVRTAGLFGEGGRNFVDAIAGRALAGQPLRVVEDQVCCRTWSVDLAAALCELWHSQVAYGTYHVTNAGGSSWYELAREVIALLGVDVSVTPVTSDQWGAAALRPRWSVLSDAAWRAAGLTPLRGEREAVTAYLSQSRQALVAR